MKLFQFQALWQRAGWLNPAFVGVDSEGKICYLSSGAPADSFAIESVSGLALPGFQNAHSHAFQYAMAGLAENHPKGTQDDFWTWREAMYQCALSVNPDQAEAVAAMLYAEMLRHGYTHVAEFHYLHHDVHGRPYDNIAEMGERMLAAAAQAGIRITLIPVFYQRANFGHHHHPNQRRFISGTREDYFQLLEASIRAVRKNSFASAGASVHSLRAVDLPDVLATIAESDVGLPFHMHIAEQQKEVNDCVAFTGQRPMEWLLNHAQVNSRFHLVHATHLNEDEVSALAKSGAHVVLCPSTEGNLGDGIFRMKEYSALGGHWSIGTDSHIGLNPLEELRMIDYRQRLITHKRNTFEGDAAAYMINACTQSGRQAMGLQADDHFAVGKHFDAVVYQGNSHLLANTSSSFQLATLLYTSDSSRVLGTIVAGKWVVKNQHHLRGSDIKAQFARAMNQLRNR
jgi:formimidoylglutamate deiminase